PILTVSLFVVLEVISNNVMEPWLYGASTGVTSLALILAAVFWAWLWGPIGLVLSTPLTVCMVVIGRHVPRLSFLSVLLSDEEPLAPHLEAYHRLLRSDLTEGTRLVDRYLASHSATELYDNVLIPVLIAAEADHGQQHIDTEQRAALHQGLRDILDDISAQADAASARDLAKAARDQAEAGEPAVDPAQDEAEAADADEAAVGADAAAGDPSALAELAALVDDADDAPTCRVLCVPVRAVRDELAADMLRNALAEQGYDVETLSCMSTSAELVDMIAAREPEMVCISVVAPSAVVHARHLCARLHQRLPALRIIVGLWSGADVAADAVSAETAQSLRASGAQAVVTSLTQAIAEIGSSPIELAPHGARAAV
ncbi:MAG TPA: cobalamin-dependent protein, partial [Planctomycetota bacterium]|nr:cobalamin-dependent protein [Planctomycetota bacterium]